MPADILSPQSARSLGEELRRAGLTIAFANGCFDLLHVGHVRYLAGASALADRLVLGVNSDASVRALKGEGRPLTPLNERLEILSHLEMVHYIIPFEEESPAGLILDLKPDFHCKGTDYTPETVPEREAVESVGGRVVIVGDPKDHDTSAIMNKIRK